MPIKEGDKVWVLWRVTHCDVCPHCNQELFHTVWSLEDSYQATVGHPMCLDPEGRPVFHLNDAEGLPVSSMWEKYLFHTHDELVSFYEELPDEDKA